MHSVNQKLALQKNTRGWLEYLIGLLHVQNADVGPQTLPILVQTCMVAMGKQQISPDNLPWIDSLFLVRIVFLDTFHYLSKILEIFLSFH